VKKIIHVDMDCFYAAVEVKHRPDLRGKPLGIGGPPNTRSVLCTANYEARKFNVHAAMPSSRAMRLCPQLILVPPNFELYKKESLAVREILRRFTPLIEPLSLDEAYLDVTDCLHFGGSATLIAKEIRRLIEHELQLTASAGIAPNKFLAKIASDWNKPNGQFAIEPNKVNQFMPPLKIEKIFGVGKVTAKQMHALGLSTCGDIQKTSPLQLAQWFGSRGAELALLARGIDHRSVEPNSERKSLTVEETFVSDIADFSECLKVIPRLYGDWERRMAKSDYRSKIRGYVVKVKFADFKSTTHEVSSRAYPQLSDFEKLLRRAWERRAEPIRLIGLGVRLSTSENNKTKNLAQLSFEI
jgi:DNA polymerase-4